MYIDNQAIYWCIDNGKSKKPEILQLIRSLYYYTVLYKIEYKAFYLPTHENTLADAVSRLEFHKLYSCKPDIDEWPTEPVSVILDF
jgi:hypothetical protein